MLAAGGLRVAINDGGAARTEVDGGSTARSMYTCMPTIVQTTSALVSLRLSYSVWLYRDVHHVHVHYMW